MGRKKLRKVFYLFEEDAEYFKGVAAADHSTHGRAMTKLLKWLRQNDIRSFDELRSMGISDK